MKISCKKATMSDLLIPMEPPMKRRAGLWIVQAGRGSYRGIFWKLEHRHDMVLVWEDGFCDTMKIRDPSGDPIKDLRLESWNKILPSIFPSTALDGDSGEYPIGLAVVKMSSASDIVGKGVVGKTAFTGNASWIYSDNILNNVSNSVIIPEYQSEWLLQFAAGINTVLLLPMMPHGVLQLGSVEMVAEDSSVVALVKNEFEAHITPSVYGSEYSARQLSMMFNFPDDLDEPSAITTRKEIDTQNTTHDVQDFGNSDSSFVADILIDLSEVDFSQLPCQLLYEDHRPFTTENDISMNFHLGEGANMPTFPDNICTFCDLDFELNRYLGTTVEDNLNPHAYGLFTSGHDLIYCTDVSGVGPIESTVTEMEAGHLLEAYIANPSGSPEDNSSNKWSIITSSNMSEKLVSSRKYGESRKSFEIGEYDVPCDFTTFESTCPGENEAKISTYADQQRERKQFNSVDPGNISSLPNTKKRRANDRDGQSPKPRDRELIQERLKELRDLVPNSEKCSIDGLLDKTVKHMLFLKNVTKQADKLRQHKEELDKKSRRPVKVNHGREKGTSWAVELGSEPQSCPVVVKDLNHPGQMLIQVVCPDHFRFLEIADVIQRFELTILNSTMEKSTDSSSWASFIVETDGSFHRLDIFWHLIKVVQQTGPPISDVS